MGLNKVCSAYILYMHRKRGQEMKASARLKWITWMPHPMHFRSTRQIEAYQTLMALRGIPCSRKKDVKMLQHVIELSIYKMNCGKSHLHPAGITLFKFNLI